MTDEKEPIDNVLADVAIERLRQDKKWGGPKHDDEHHMKDFVDFINLKSEGVIHAMVISDPNLLRKRLIQIAALAVAAIEMQDRYVVKMADYRKDPVNQPENMNS